ncbi:MAG: peptidylprolyl isomerase [Clostridiales Family XIII bacterium]|jgi:foldase protein PrsA|nr:peptidylprolyl isomerase [Clostridiales Family XIII bacterium]
MKKKNAKKSGIAIAAAFLALMLCAGSALTGCGGGADKSEVVAEVGDVKITEDRLSAFTELMFFLYGYDFANVSDESERNLMKADTLDTMVQVAAMEQYFKEKNVLPEDADERLKQFKEIVSQTDGVADSFEEKGITDDILRYYLETQFYFQALADEATNGGVLPTEEEIEAYYAAHAQEYSDEEERRVSHILVGDSTYADADRQLAEEIREKIASGQETFEDMALEYGTDGTRDTGGDLGYAMRSAYVTEFSDVAFTLPQDELSDIVETEFGFHILKVTDIRSTRSIEAQRENIRETLTYGLYDEKAQALTEDFGVTYLSDKYPAPDDRVALGESAGAAGTATDAEGDAASE